MGDLAATTRKRAKAGRKRRVAGWGWLAVGVLIAGAWGASAWWWFGCTGPTWSAFFGRGHIEVSIAPGMIAMPSKWIAERLSDAPTVQWLFPNQGRWAESEFLNYGIARYEVFSDVRTFEIMHIMLWPFALVSLLGGGWLVWSGRRARRRAMTGVCLKCGYDLAGLAAGAPCPECGGGAV